MFMQNFDILACICSLADWFLSRLVVNSVDRFSRNEAHLLHNEFSFITQ